MKLLTLNCHSWQEENQWEKMDTLAGVIHEQSYDVIALQEVSQSITAENTDGNVKTDNFVLLLIQKLKELGSAYDYTWDFSHIGYDRFEEGVALLTKHPIIYRESFFVSRSEDTSFWKTRKVVGLTIDFNGKAVAFYSCHMGWWKDEEEPFRFQMDQLAEQVDQSTPHFLMGDFNNEAGVKQEGYAYCLDLGYYDTYQLAQERDSGITVGGEIAGWEKNGEKKRIDFIFASEKVNVPSSAVVFNGSNMPVISDHFGVEVVIK
ncbi:endonuclease/exonuclease/phosphatase family protein [Virgibacillus ainsalahensis]